MPKIGYKQTEEHRRKNSENHKNKKNTKETILKRIESLKKFYGNNPNSKCGFQKGVKRSKESRLKQSKTLKCHKISKETKEKIGKANSISLKEYFETHFSWNKGLTKETDKRVRNHANKQKISIKNLWSNEKYRKSQTKSILNSNKPTGFEKDLIRIVKKYNLPFIYTGNGSFLIGYKNPDFINKRKKICIEIFYDYFKKKDYGSVKNYERIRGTHFEKFGWKTIFIDSNELKKEEEIVKKLVKC